MAARAVGSPVPWLAAVIAVSALARAAIGAVRDSPWILPDELLYAELARGVADGGVPSVRGVTTVGWGVVYPYLIAPAFALTDDPVVAYHGALAISALAVSLAAVPAYLLARLFVPRTTAIVVAAGSVLVSAAGQTSVVMTETVAYPAFLLGLWLVARTVRVPTLAGQTAMLLAIAFASLARAQCAILLPVFLVSAALYARGLPIGARASYARRLTPSIVVGLVAAAAPVVLGGVTEEALGGRSGTIGAVRLAEVPRVLLFQTADLILVVAMVPALATAAMVVVGLSRGRSERQRLFASVAAPTIAGVVLTVAAAASSSRTQRVEDVNERYVVYLVPLLLLGLAFWSRSGRPRPRPAAAAALAVALLPALLPFDRLEFDASFYAPALAPWVALPFGSPGTGVVTGFCGVGVWLLWARCRAPRVAVLWGITSVAMALLAGITLAAHGTHARTAAGLSGGERRTWIEAALPWGAEASLVWDQRRAQPGAEPADVRRAESTYYGLMVTEFFNPAVGAAYRLGDAAFYENVLPVHGVRIGEGGVLLTDRGRPLATRYVLASCDLEIRGRRVAESDNGAFVLTRVTGPVRVGAAGRCPADAR